MTTQSNYYKNLIPLHSYGDFNKYKNVNVSGFKAGPWTGPWTGPCTGPWTGP